MMNTSFLNYTGIYSETNDEKFSFLFKDGTKKIMDPIFIFPIIYEIPFNIVFSYDKSGREFVKDCLNSILFPCSQSILEISSDVPKEFQRTSDSRYGKGTKKVDDAFYAKIKDGNKTRNILIVLEIGKFFNNSSNEKNNDYGDCLRTESNSKETWVISFCFEDAKIHLKDKFYKSNVIKQYNGGNINTYNYITVYEIFMNNLYKNIDENISVFPNEFIQEEGKEWIKFFTIHLWSKNYGAVENYLIPSGITFNGKKIKEAIDKINIRNINEVTRVKIFTDIRYENQVKKENEKNLALQYIEEYQRGFEEEYPKGFKEGYQRGFEEEYQKGFKDSYKQEEAIGIIIGRQLEILKLLDKFYINYINGKSIENIDILGTIPRQLVNERYSGLKLGQDFIHELSLRNLLS